MRRSPLFFVVCVLTCLACCSCGFVDLKTTSDGISDAVKGQTIPLVFFSNDGDSSVLWYSAEWNTILGTVKIDDNPFVQCEADQYWEVIRWDGGEEFVFSPRTSHREKLKDDEVSLRWLDQSEVDMCHYLDTGVNVSFAEENEHFNYEVKLTSGEEFFGTIPEPPDDDTSMQVSVCMSLIEIGQRKNCVNFVFLYTLETSYALRSAILDLDKDEIVWTEMAPVKDEWAVAYASLVSGKVAFSDDGLIFGAGDTVLCYTPEDAKIDKISTIELDSISSKRELSGEEEGLDFMNFKSYWDSQGNETIIGYYPRLSKGDHVFYFLLQKGVFVGAVDISSEEVEVYDSMGGISQEIDVSQLGLAGIHVLFPDSGACY